ncbi:MAG: ATP-dependent DNA helicase RecG [Elusimicrobia bacterium]|nr:ATP-dependent DNA helicase RecG [Elusimicrobiota bacterium]
MPDASVLGKPAQYLTGVGPKRAELLARLELHTVGDLVNHLPRSWEDRAPTPPGRGVPADAPLVLRGRVVDSFERRAGPHLLLMVARMAVPEHGEVEAVWFKRPSRSYDVLLGLKKDLARGTDLWLVGRGEPGLLKARRIDVDEHYRVDDPRSVWHVGGLVGRYATTEGLTERWLRETIGRALEEAADAVVEDLPPDLLARRELLARPQALRAVHRPRSAAELEEGRRRLAYDELLLLGLAWALKHRQIRRVDKGYGYEVRRSLLTPFKAALGFEMTRAQKRVVNEIFEDMRRPAPMTRLLQGDVGSGKTVVALAALLLAAENGRQGAFMAPTEILADQHFWTFKRFLADLPVRVELLTSSVPKARRTRILERVAAGEVDIVLGTHALLEGAVKFKSLALAVIDEQHRFGVRQRTTLRQKGPAMDLLLMTATPIPRTLALALYGDLDASTVDEMPPGRAAVSTLHCAEERALEAVRLEAARGRQSYIVYPIIEESARLDLKAATAEFDRLKKGALSGLRAALVHGRLPGPKKVAVMDEFAAGRVDVLVTTPVIEVGVDVPNAAVMVIQNADRFGLASLHQLRGRIGRGKDPGKCFLVCDPKSDAARRRIQVLCETTDGFRIGEEDLKLRGPGEALGTAQHGELGLAAADLARDADLLAASREDAEGLLAADADLAKAENAGLRRRLVERYQERWKSIDLA